MSIGNRFVLDGHMLEWRPMQPKPIGRDMHLPAGLYGHQLPGLAQLLLVKSVLAWSRSLLADNQRLHVHMLPGLHGAQLRESDKRVRKQPVSQQRHMYGPRQRLQVHMSMRLYRFGVSNAGKSVRQHAVSQRWRMLSGLTSRHM